MSDLGSVRVMSYDVIRRQRRNTTLYFKGHLLKKVPQHMQKTSPRFYLVYMRFPYLSSENTWPQGTQAPSSSPWVHMGPGPGPAAQDGLRAAGKGRQPARARGPCGPKGLSSALEPTVGMYFHKECIEIRLRIT